MTKPPSEKSYHHKDLRQSLIKAALELIAQKQDASTLSLREVARRVGVSNAAPYRHFADKNALLAAVAEEGFYILTRYLHSSIENTSDDPLHQLQVSGVAYVKFAISHPSHYRVMFSAFKADNLCYPSLNAAGQEAFAVMMNAIASGQQLGKIKVGEPRQLAWVTWSLVHGLAMLLIDHQLPIIDEQDIVAVAELATQSLINGMRS
ncbi:MAG: TetR/AcrR family transcriptional regulator [Symploca sp. SIO2E6]|nr:TetR/AcrR family transcriptional regulator [Symploca sp. SIO2E6]